MYFAVLFEHACIHTYIHISIYVRIFITYVHSHTETRDEFVPGQGEFHLGASALWHELPSCRREAFGWRTSVQPLTVLLLCEQRLTRDASAHSYSCKRVNQRLLRRFDVHTAMLNVLVLYTLNSTVLS